MTAGLECSGPTGGSAGHGSQVHSAQPAWCLQAMISRLRNHICIAAFAVSHFACVFDSNSKKSLALNGRVCGGTRYVEAQCLSNCLWQCDLVDLSTRVVVSSKFENWGTVLGVVLGDPSLHTSAEPDPLGLAESAWSSVLQAESLRSACMLAQPLPLRLLSGPCTAAC